MTEELEIDISDFKEEKLQISKNKYIYTFFNELVVYAGKIFYIDISDQKSFNEKISRLKSIVHPTILKVFGYAIKDSYPVIITEFMKHKSLEDLFYRQLHKGKSNGWNDTKKYITAIGIAHGIQFLHSQEKIHKNLRPSKILFDADYYPHISLLDILINTEEKNGNDLIYLAPEFLDDSEAFSKASDIYAFSMIVFQLLKEKPPFKNPKIIINDIRNQNYPDISSFSYEMQTFFQSCWDFEPENRKTIDEVIELFMTDEVKEQFGNVDEDEVSSYVSNL